MTAQPYLGYDALEPFLGRADRGVFILCRTSNPGAQRATGPRPCEPMASEAEPLYLRVARQVANEWNANGNCGLVVGATYPEELRQVREIVGDLPHPRAGRRRAGRRPRRRRCAPELTASARACSSASSRAILYASSGRRLRQRGAAPGRLAAHGDRAAAWRPRKQRRLPQEWSRSGERSRTGRIPMSDADRDTARVRGCAARRPAR